MTIEGTQKFDAIVIGLGAIGSAALFHLASRGLNVLGLEKFRCVHELGSHHGETRLIRKAYFEHPDYVPLLERAYQLWQDLGVLSDTKLFEKSGVAIFGPEESAVLQGVRYSANLHSLEIENVAGDDLAQRFPEFSLPRGYEAVFEPDAGFLHVEAGVRAHLSAAQQFGAQIQDQTSVLAWSQHEEGVEVVTRESTFRCDHLVLCAGAWSEDLSELEALPIAVHRQVLAWFQGDSHFALEHGTPCFAFDLPEGFHYGFPDIGGSGVKFASHEKGIALTSADERDKEGVVGEIEKLGEVLTRHVPGATPEVLRSTDCLYSMTPDQHFVVDRHPDYRNVFLAAGFSGHGYKFSPVIGEQLADFVTAGEPSLPMNFLRYRF